MAVRALENAVVARIGMADRTHSIRSAVIRVEPGVIEGGAQPAAGGMAGRAGGRKTCSLVIGIRRAAVILGMTAVTVGRQRRVVVVHVATGARHGGMRPGQRKAGVVVIERRLSPRSRVVTDVALLWEADRGMIRIIRVLKIGQVAGHARG